MALTYEVIEARRLGGEYLSRWQALLPRSGDLASPFFRPEYTQAVAEVREGVELCVIRDGREVVGFYPFERIEPRVGRPVGGGMSNFQGTIAVPGVAWSATGIAHAARLDVLKFHHQVTEQTQFVPYTLRTAPAPIVDVAGGWDAYLGQRKLEGISTFNALPRKMRKLEQTLGPISFVPHTRDAAALDRLVEWKRGQYVRTATHGSLEHEWALDILRRLMAAQSPDFAGMLSALYAGDRLIAVHAGMRTATVWHYWYPAYDPAVGQHSPGLVLMLEMCKWASGAGLHRIDLGPGEGAHKGLFRTSETTVSVGQVVVPPRRGLLGRMMRQLRNVG